METEKLLSCSCAFLVVSGWQTHEQPHLGHCRCSFLRQMCHPLKCHHCSHLFLYFCHLQVLCFLFWLSGFLPTFSSHRDYYNLFCSLYKYTHLNWRYFRCLLNSLFPSHEPLLPAIYATTALTCPSTWLNWNHEKKETFTCLYCRAKMWGGSWRRAGKMGGVLWRGEKMERLK